MRHFLVDVVCIASGEPRERFDPALVEQLADAILESGGLLKPLVLKAEGPESFSVVDGHLEYWAAVRAREKDPRKGEMVNAYVVPPKSGEAVERQLSSLRRAEGLRSFSSGMGEEVPSRPNGAEETSVHASSAAEEALLRVLRENFARWELRFESFAASLSRLESLAPRLDRVEDELLRKMSVLEESLSASNAKSAAKKKPVLPEEPFTHGALMKATLAVLKEIAEAKGVDVKGLRKKQEVADAILKHAAGA